jgi:hypothetical protein
MDYSLHSAHIVKRRGSFQGFVPSQTGKHLIDLYRGQALQKDWRANLLLTHVFRKVPHF